MVVVLAPVVVGGLVVVVVPLVLVVVDEVVVGGGLPEILVAALASRVAVELGVTMLPESVARFSYPDGEVWS